MKFIWNFRMRGNVLTVTRIHMHGPPLELGDSILYVCLRLAISTLSSHLPCRYFSLSGSHKISHTIRSYTRDIKCCVSLENRFCSMWIVCCIHSVAVSSLVLCFNIYILYIPFLFPAALSLCRSRSMSSVHKTAAICLPLYGLVLTVQNVTRMIVNDAS